MHKAVYVSVRCMVITVHEICEDLPQDSIAGPTPFYCKLMIFLIMPSVTLVSIMIILFSTLSVMRHLICGNNYSWLLNLNLTYVMLWAEAGKSLLISNAGNIKLAPFDQSNKSGANGVKMDGSILEEK